MVGSAASTSWVSPSCELPHPSYLLTQPVTEPLGQICSYELIFCIYHHSIRVHERTYMYTTFALYKCQKDANWLLTCGFKDKEVWFHSGIIVSERENKVIFIFLFCIDPKWCFLATRLFHLRGRSLKILLSSSRDVPKLII